MRTSASRAVAIRAGKRPEVLVIRLQGRVQRERPAKPLKLRRDLGVIRVGIIAAARADELEHAGVAALGAAVHDANRLAAHECRPAVSGLSGKREYHPDAGPQAQPRVTASVQTRRGDGGQADSGSGTGHRVRVTRTTHSTHRQSVFPELPRSGAAFSHLTIHAGAARRNVQPELDTGWLSIVPQSFASASYDVSGSRCPPRTAVVSAGLRRYLHGKSVWVQSHGQT